MLLEINATRSEFPMLQEYSSKQSLILLDNSFSKPLNFIRDLEKPLHKTRKPIKTRQPTRAAILSVARGSILIRY